MDERDQGRQQDQAMLQRAAQLRAPLMKVARSAASNCLWYAIFGVLTVLFSLSTQASDLVALGVAAALLYVGLNGRSLAARLRNGDADAARRLARNELVLMGAIGVYAVLMLTVIKPVGDEIDRALAGSSTPISTEGLRVTIYVSVLAITVLYQGLLSMRYRRAVPAAELYLAEVPDWAREAVASLPG